MKESPDSQGRPDTGGGPVVAAGTSRRLPAPDAMVERAALRRCMNTLNRSLMTPLVANPVSGYLMLLRTTGRRSGKARYAPMNYAIIDGVVYCIAAWGRASSWHANLVADPRVEAILPGGAIADIAEEMTDPTERERALVQVASNAGLAVLFDGVKPLSATDRQLVARVGEGARVVRIRPTSIGNGPHDPHGLAWIPSTPGAGWPPAPGPADGTPGAVTQRGRSAPGTVVRAASGRQPARRW